MNKGNSNLRLNKRSESKEKPLTRSRVAENPVLKDEIINPFKKSVRIGRSPPELGAHVLENQGQSISTLPVKSIDSSTVTNSEKRNLGAVKKVIFNTEFQKNFAEESPSKSKENTADLNKSLKDFSNENWLNSSCNLDITFDHIKQEEFTDIGGILNEQSLLLENYNQQNISINEGVLRDNRENLIDFGSVSNTENNNIQESQNSSNLGARKLQVNQGNLEDNSETLEEQNQEMAQNVLKLPLMEVARLVPEFHGSRASAIEFIKRLKQVKTIIEEADERNLVNLLKFKIKGEASGAFDSSEITKIDDFIGAIRNVYPTNDNIHILYGQLSQIFQKENESVISYTNRLRNLVLQIKELKRKELRNDQQGIDAFNTTLDADAIKYYKDGLKFEIKVVIGNHNSLEGFSLDAIAIENKISQQKNIRSAVNTMHYSAAETPILEQKTVLTCQICRDFHHEALFCKSAACVYCKGTDHFSNSCRFVSNKIQLICRYCSQPGHSISSCAFNRRQGNHCQYCQEMGHEVGQCPFIRDYEVCWKCKESGHNPNLCPNKNNKSEYCEYCGIHGHNMQSCSEVLCQKCNQKGHTIKFCKTGEDKIRFRICTFCEESGHEAAECDQVKVLVAQYKAKQQLKCQICDNVGHIAKNCFKFKNAQNPQGSNYGNNVNGSVNQNRSNFSNNTNKNFNKSNFYNNINTRDNATRKTCEYCSALGHSIEECRKVQALQNFAQNKVHKQCSFCKNIGHTIDVCQKLKSIENSIDKFCNVCKGIGHTPDNCYKNPTRQQNQQGNDQSSPGESV